MTAAQEPGTGLRRLGAVPAGTLVLAGTSYVFLVLAARVLGPERYASFAVVWALVYFVGPGVFTPVEQQAARGIAHARSIGGPLRPHVLRAAKAAAGLLAALLVVLVLLRGVVARELELGDAMLAGLAASLFGLSVAHPLRGGLAGLGRLPAYGAGLALEGVLRLGGGLVLAATSLRSAALFGALAGLPAAAGAAFGALRRRTGDDAGFAALTVVPPTATSDGQQTSRLVQLVVAALCAQLLINVPPVAVAALATTAERVAAGQLLAGLLIARVPLLAVATVQTVVLPQLVVLYSGGRRAEAARLLRRLAGACLAIAIVGAGAAAVLGPDVMRLVFGPVFALSSLDLALLVVAVAAYLLATLLGLGLVAARREAALAWCWVAGVVVAFLVLVVVPGLVLRVELALVAGCCTSAALVTGRTAALLGRSSGEAPP